MQTNMKWFQLCLLSHGLKTQSVISEIETRPEGGPLSEQTDSSLHAGRTRCDPMRTIVRLWCHECTRMFSDRILTAEGTASQTRARKSSEQCLIRSIT